MDTDGKDVSGDESIVLVLDNKRLAANDELQFFDNKVKLNTVFTNPASIVFKVCDNEGGGSQNCANDQVLNVGQVAKYQRGMIDNRGPFYIKLIAVDTNTKEAVIEVGRMFGQTLANIGANARWNQKAFIVDEVFYNVAAIKTRVVNGVEQFKYIVIRQKLPKDEIKLYGKHLKVWGTNELLPELPPFNMPHEIIVDVLTTQAKPANMQDKIGEKIPARPLVITYVLEAKEPRFQGQLKEIYNQPMNVSTPPPPPPVDGAALYASNCAGCHGPLATSTKLGSTAAEIQAAINSNKGGMGSLSTLTPAQVQAIADALATTPPPIDGAALYASKCAGCHGPLATSTKLGSTAVEIQNAINSNKGGMGSLSALTSAQVQAIADALSTSGASIKNLDGDAENIVDIGDLGVLVGHYGEINANLDLDNDPEDMIDIGDIGVLVGKWGETESS